MFVQGKPAERPSCRALGEGQGGVCQAGQAEAQRGLSIVSMLQGTGPWRPSLGWAGTDFVFSILHQHNHGMTRAWRFFLHNETSPEARQDRSDVPHYIQSGFETTACAESISSLLNADLSIVQFVKRRWLLLHRQPRDIDVR